MPPKKCDTPFQAHHVAEFGLRICERAVGNSTAVVTTACRFCEVFGKEESEVGMKRGRSERVKYFKAPFRKENYSSHHTRMHNTQWAEYRELEVSAKKSFFDIGTISSSQTTMHAFAAPRTPQVNVLIDKDIVDVIIGEMMFHPEDMDGITWAHLLKSFVPTLDSSKDAVSATSVDTPSPSPTPSSFSWLYNIWLLDYRFVRWHRWLWRRKRYSASGALARALRVLWAAMLVLSVRWICSASRSCCDSAGRSLLRSTWRPTWQPRTAMFASASATNPLCMTSTFCPSLCMSDTQAKLSSTRSPRRWTLFSRTNARQLLEHLRMARRRWQGDIRA